MALSERVPEVLRRWCSVPFKGDVGAARLILERVVPPLKGREQAVVTMPCRTAQLTEQGRAVLAAVAGGELAPGQGAQLVAAIGNLARVAED